MESSQIPSPYGPKDVAIPWQSAPPAQTTSPQDGVRLTTLALAMMQKSVGGLVDAIRPSRGDGNGRLASSRFPSLRQQCHADCAPPGLWCFRKQRNQLTTNTKAKSSKISYLRLQGEAFCALGDVD